MGNYDLYLKFIEIAAHNPFDAYCQLKDLNKTYKKSDFYKRTHMPIKRAYEFAMQSMFTQLYFTLRELTNVSSWVAKFSAFVDDLDEDQLGALINKITSSFGANDLQIEKGELQDLLNQMKSLK